MAASPEDRLDALLARRWGMLIGGQFVQARSGHTMSSVSPVDGRVLAEVPLAEPEDVDRAVQAGKQAFLSWRHTPLVERARLVRLFAARLRERAEDFALLDAVDGGNPFSAMVGDVHMAAGFLDYHAGVAYEVKGDTLASPDASWLLTRREPYGVVGRIIAYNHPIMFAASKVGAPVVMGNSVVIKAPDQAPLSTLLMGEVVNEVFPPGVVNLITGTGSVSGDALVRHPDIKRLTLVGSVPTGQRVQAAAAEAGIKNVSLELGGKNPMIVFPDVDLDAAAAGAAAGMNCHWCQGQSCGSITRLFLHEDVHDEILERLIRRLSGIRLGHPLDPATEMGCLISQAQYDKVTSYIQSGIEDGARLVLGGGKPAGEVFARGHFIEPTVFADVDMGMRIAKNEIFGPVLSVFRWKDMDAVIDEANSLPYGLTGSVWTNNLKSALTVAERLDTGYVWVNGSSRHFLGAPFSGHRSSGIDSEESIEELISFTQLKTVNFAIQA